MFIRKAEVKDAQAFIDFCAYLDQETKFMLYEPGERGLTLEDQARRFASLYESDESIMLLAVTDQGGIAGFAAGIGSSLKRSRHAVSVVIGIRQHYSGQGLGSRLMEEVEHWADAAGKHRLQLTVMTHNERAIQLYTKRGFRIEGTLNRSLRVDDQFVDEYMMAKLIHTGEEYSDGTRTTSSNDTNG
ncbi:GNAT family N-acetyltransferase [Paenibacillus thiaminolyticus]|uniref:GNAT family N-acetyltransferase n=1 Tax=Paenibacillus thiaminolyticus TaxID=49283 RepID=UPI003D2C6D8B